MKLSINANYLFNTRIPNYRRPVEDIFQFCADAGFSILDFTPFYDEEWEKNVDETLRAAEKFNMEIEQSHAPFNFYSRLAPEKFSELLNRSVEGAIRMKNRQLVFHMDEYHAPSSDKYDAKAALNSAYEALAPHIEKALANGVRVGLETIFEDKFTQGKQERSHFGGVFEELLASIERFNHPDVGCCWDFGHARIAYEKEQMEMMRRLGKRIICTHTHDNYYGRDLHLMPFAGDLPWEGLMHTLKEIGYEGNLTFEYVYGNYPDRLVPGFLKQTYETGLVLIDMFEGKEVR